MRCALELARGAPLLAALLCARMPAQDSRASSRMLEAKVLAALRSESPDVRGGAAQLLALCGGPEHVEPLAKLLADENADVRSAVAVALGTCGGPKAVSALQRMIRDPVTGATAAYCLCANARPGEHWPEIGELLGGRDFELVYVVLLGLTRCRARGSSREYAALLESRPRERGHILQGLDLLTDPADAGVIEPLLASANQVERHRAEAAWLRLGKHLDHEPLSATTFRGWVEGTRWMWDSEATATRLARERTIEVTRDAVTRAAAGARVVLVGSDDQDQSRLREILGAMLGAEDADVAVGMTWSVRDFASGVAKALKAPIVELEPHGRQNAMIQHKPASVEEVAGNAREWLAAGEKRRLLVVCQCADVLGDSHLLGRLGDQTVAIVTRVPLLPLHALGARPAVAGRSFEIGAKGRVFAEPSAEFDERAPRRGVLKQWIETH